MSADMDKAWELAMKMNDELRAENAELKSELERERIRLAACGVVALANTPDSAAKAREMHEDYRSASCDDVARSVDSEMKLRAENAELKRIIADNQYKEDVEAFMEAKRAEWEKGVLEELRQKVTNQTADWGWCVEVMIDEMLDRGGVRND